MAILKSPAKVGASGYHGVVDVQPRALPLPEQLLQRNLLSDIDVRFRQP